MIRVKNPNYVERLPDEYQEVEYLESTGTQYINLNLIPTSTMTFEIEAQISNLTTETDMCLFGSRSKAGSTDQYILWDGVWTTSVEHRTTLVVGSLLEDYVVPKLKRNVFKYDGSNFLINNEIVLNKSNTMTSSTYQLYLFGLNQGGSLEARTYQGRVFYFKIWDAGVLVRDYIPCYRKSDNIPGIYDLINNVFYTNTETGAFLVGKDTNKRDVNIKPGLREKNIFLPNEYQGLEYLHSTDAQQYIDTNFYATSEHVKYETKVLVQANTAYQALWGQYRSDSTSMIINAYTPSAGVLRFYAGATDGMTNTDFTISSNTDYEIVCEANNGTFTRTINGNTVTSTYSGNLNKQDAPILFAQRESVANEIRSYSGSRFYYFKIYDNNKLVCSFVPCYRKSDNVKGMYDMVRQTFHPFEGTGAVAIGAEKEHESIKIQNFLSQRYVGGKLVYGEPLVDYEYRYVAVGTGGNSAYSIDGETWTSMNGGSSYDDFGVVYGNNRFVKIGRYGDSYYSIDGINWTAMTGLASALYYGVAYGNNRFVCVGESGKSYYSTDGETWNGNNGIASANFYGICYGNDRFVAVGASGKSYYSTDGISWKAMSGASRDLYGVTYGNGMFVTVGTVGGSYYSTDGETWTFSSLGNDIMNYGVAYGNGTFVAIANNGSLSKYSTNGTSWSNVSGLSSNAFRGITYGNDRFIAVGESGASYYSMDGKTWTAMTGLASATYYGVCCGRKAIPKYSQLKNYTMLYDNGDECTDITGGWEEFQNNTTYKTVLNKNTNSLYIGQEFQTGQNRNGGYRTINEIDCTNFSMVGSLTQDIVCTNSVPRIYIEQSNGTQENIIRTINSNDDHDGKLMKNNSIVLNATTKFCVHLVGGAQGAISMYLLGLILYKPDDWQKLCAFVGLSSDDYADEATLCTDGTAIEEILNNKDAVEYMIKQCTGSFMGAFVASSIAIAALENSPYKTKIYANEHWNKFLAMVA